MAFKLKDARRAWREKKWQMQAAADARLGRLAKDFVEWFDKDKRQRGPIFRAISAGLSVVWKGVGISLRALLNAVLAANAGWSIVTVRLSWREKLELTRIVARDGVVDGVVNLESLVKLIRNKRARGSSKFLGRLLASEADKHDPNIQIIEILLEAGASLVERKNRVGILENMNLDSEESRAALIELTSAGAKPMAWTKKELKTLRRAEKKKPELAEKMKRDPLWLALAHGWLDGIEVLAPLADIQTLEKRFGGAIAWACLRRQESHLAKSGKEGARRSIQALARAGADINTLSKMGMSPLSIALSRGDMDWAAELMTAGAKLDASRQKILNEEIPSIEASDLAILAVTYAHCHHGNDTEPDDSDEEFLALKGLVERMLEKGARLGSFGAHWIDMNSEEFMSAIHWAVARSNLRLLKVLLPLCGATAAERGAALEQRSSTFKREGGQGPIVSSRGATPLWVAVRSGNVAAAKMLLNAGAKISADGGAEDQRPEPRQASLLACAAGASPSMVKFVLGLMEFSQEQHDEAFWWGSGVSIGILEELAPSSMSIELHGQSCFERAILLQKRQGYLRQDQETARWLIERGVAATIKKDDEALSLFNLAQSFQQSCWVEMQIQGGADVWMLNEEGHSTLDCAGKNIYQGRLSMHDQNLDNSGEDVARIIFTKMLENPRRALLYAKRAERRLRADVEERRERGSPTRQGDLEMVELMARLADVAADKKALQEAAGGEVQGEAPAKRARKRL